MALIYAELKRMKREDDEEEARKKAGENVELVDLVSDTESVVCLGEGGDDDDGDEAIEVDVSDSEESVVVVCSVSRSSK